MEDIFYFNPIETVGAELYRMDADGRHQTRLTYDNAIASNPVYSPDGNKIIFSSNRENRDEKL